MKRIYIIVAGAFLILLVIISIILSFQKKSTTSNSSNSPFPTGIPNSNLSNKSNMSNESNSPVDISLIAPVETKDFKLQFSSQLDKLVVEKKTPEAEQKFDDWAKQNNYPQLISNNDQVLMAEAGQTPHNFNPMLDFFSIFMTFGQGSSSSNGQTNSSPTNSDSLAPSPATSNSTQNNNQSRVYYAQCGDQGNLALPDGCNFCSAGCGAASVSMIASSYLGNNFNPKTIVNLYQSRGYLLGCDGSRYSDAHELLKSLGLKTTDYLVFNSEKADTVVPQLKKYLAAGWTFFTLASFCDGGCGHYFWITNIDDKGNIMAYDPAYGRYEIPYNENSRYPYPLYRLAFGVKK